MGTNNHKHDMLQQQERPFITHLLSMVSQLPLYSLVETKGEQFSLWSRLESNTNLKEKRAAIIWSMELLGMDKLNKQNTRQKRNCRTNSLIANSLKKGCEVFFYPISR